MLYQYAASTACSIHLQPVACQVDVHKSPLTCLYSNQTLAQAEVTVLKSAREKRPAKKDAPLSAILLQNMFMQDSLSTQ